MQIKVRQTEEVLEVHKLLTEDDKFIAIVSSGNRWDGYEFGVDADFYDPEKEQLLLEVKRLKEALRNVIDYPDSLYTEDGDLKNEFDPGDVIAKMQKIANQGLLVY